MKPTYSAEEARRRDESNIAYKKAIEDSVCQHFNGMRLNESCIQQGAGGGAGVSTQRSRCGGFSCGGKYQSIY